MIKLSVVIINHNEAENLAEAIQSAQFASEVVVVDGESTDNSVEVAQRLGAKVVAAPNQEVHNINREIGFENASGEWVFILDTDERITPQLAQEIRQVIESPGAYRGFSVPRKNFYAGHWLKHGGLYPDRTTRLIKRGDQNLPKTSPHAGFEVRGLVGELRESFLHYSYRSVGEHWKKTSRYADFDASKWLQEGIPSRHPLLRFLFKEPALVFWRGYLVKQGFRDGLYGLVFWLISALHPILAFLRYHLSSL